MEKDLKDVMTEALTDAQAAFFRMDSSKLKSISDHTIRYAGIFQDPYSITIAIVVYSLAKIVERRNIREDEEGEAFRQDIIGDLRAAQDALNKDDDKGYLENLKRILNNIGNIDKKLGNYVTEVIEKARIKKGSLIYKHGLSVGRAAELMGISPWELMDYIGQTRVADEMPVGMKKQTERLKEARRIFNLK